jgi:protein TonB
MAYYLTNAALFLLILSIFGYMKYQQWRYEEMKKKMGTETGKKVITLTYAQLGPPPSIQGAADAGTPTSAAPGARPSAPVVGVPKPVPDAQAVAETSPDQLSISGTSSIPGAGTGTGSGDVTIRVEEVIPDINAYVPHEVDPKIIVQTKPRYPDIARKMEWEGTVFYKALVDLDGSVMRVVVLRSSGFPTLDTAAVEAVLSWKLTPAMQNKKPVRVWIGGNLRFRLE